MNLKNYIKALIVLGIFVLSASTALAASYPATCPAEAQAIVGAVGGCGAISADQYASIYSKCCSTQPATAVTTTTKKPIKKAAASSKPIPLQPIQPPTELTTSDTQPISTIQTTTPQISHTALLFIGSAIGGIGFWCIVIIFFIRIVKFIIRKFSKNPHAEPSKKTDLANNIAIGMFILGIILAGLAIALK